MSAPLAGLRVLDLSRVLAGPWASQLLADYGAEVIKIERPGAGDDTRRWGPPWLTDGAGDETAESAYFLSANRNKKSVTVNIADAAGQQIVRELAARSDILIENFRVGSLRRFGLDAAALQGVNPGLIYCSISAYGQNGPRAGEAGYDAMIQASGGLMSITGEPDGPPQKVGVAVSDIMAGMYAVTAVLAALHARRETGVGQHIDVPLYDTQLAWLANQAMNYLVGGDVPVRHGTAHPNIVPYQAFRTRDGHLMLAVGNDRQFAACVDCLGIGELAEDARFAANRDRVLNRKDLVSRMENAFLQRPTAEWLALLGKRRIPCGPINDLAQAFAEPQVAARNLLQDLPHGLGGSVTAIANPVRFSDTPTELMHAAPLLGEHTAAVLGEFLGYSQARIDELTAAGTL